MTSCIAVITDTDDAGLHRTLGPYPTYHEASIAGEQYVDWLHDQYGVEREKREWEYNVMYLQTIAEAAAEEATEIAEEKRIEAGK
jgi:hypothetical protein